MPIVTDVLNPQAWYRDDTEVYSDDGVTSAAHDGTIQRWDDQSGNNYNATQSAEGTKPKYYTSGGKTGIAVDYWRTGSAGANRQLTFPAGLATNPQAFTITAVIEANTTDRNGYIVNLGAITPSNSNVRIGWLNGVIVLWDGTNTRTTSLLLPSTKCAVALRGSTTEFVCYLNTVTNDASYAAAPPASLTGGEISGSNGGWGTWHEVTVHNSALSDTNIANLLNYHIARHSITTTPNRRIIIDGDSLSEGTGASLNQTWWRRINMPSSWEVVCHAIAGQTLATAEADAVADIDPWFTSSTTEDWIFVELATNDLVGGTGTAVLHALLQTYCNARKTAGVDKVVIFTLNINASGATLTLMNTYNGLLRTDFTGTTPSAYVFTPASGITYADYLVDLAAHPTIGTASDHMTNWIGGGDLFHLNDAGYAIWAGLIDTGIFGTGPWYAPAMESWSAGAVAVDG